MSLSINSPRKPRKVALKPGHSPLDWARLTSSSASLRGPVPESLLARQGRITKTELVKHCHKNDCWTILGGRVYNLTAYLPYHPGGEGELMRVAGKDGTALFMELHAWVNFEMMLAKCNVGIYVGDSAES